jgi:hypothetical protein
MVFSITLTAAATSRCTAVHTCFPTFHSEGTIDYLGNVPDSNV